MAWRRSAQDKKIDPGQVRTWRQVVLALAICFAITVACMMVAGPTLLLIK